MCDIDQMPDAREWERIQILAAVYLLGEARIGREIEIDKIVAQSCIDENVFDIRLMSLHFGNYLMVSGSPGVSIELHGVRHFESALRTALVKAGDWTSVVELQKHITVYLDCEWERFDVMESLYRLAGLELHTNIQIGTLQQQAGLDNERFRRAARYLTAACLIKFSPPRNVCMTESGRDYVEQLLMRLRERRVQIPAKPEFQAVLVSTWMTRDFDCARLEREAGFCPSQGYKTVHIRGHSFALTKQQARVVKLLHVRIQSKTPHVPKATLIAELGWKSGRLSDVFGPSHLEAYEALVKQSAQDLYRLNI